MYSVWLPNWHYKRVHYNRYPSRRTNTINNNSAYPCIIIFCADRRNHSSHPIQNNTAPLIIPSYYYWQHYVISRRHTTRINGTWIADNARKYIIIIVSLRRADGVQTDIDRSSSPCGIIIIFPCITSLSWRAYCCTCSPDDKSNVDELLLLSD